MAANNDGKFYYELLRKYMEHVDNCEGTDFVDQLTEQEFTEDEIEILNQISRQNGN